MNDFHWWLAGLVFVFYVIVDALYVLYTKAIQENRPVVSANLGAAMYGLYALGTLAIIQNTWNIIFIVLGSWLGTYFTVKYQKNLDLKSK